MDFSRHFFGVRAGIPRWVCLGRLLPGSSSTRESEQRTLPILVHHAGTGLLSADVDLVVGGMAMVGRSSGRVSCGERLAPRHQCHACMDGAGAIEDPWRVAGGIDLCRASRQRRDRGMDQRAEEYTVDAFLPHRDTDVSAI